MPAAKTAAETPETVTKKEACALLGRSERAVEGYARQGRLRRFHMRTNSGRTALYAKADVESLKEELGEAVIVPPRMAELPNSVTPSVAPAAAAVVRSGQLPPDPFAGLAEKFAALAVFAAKYAPPPVEPDIRLLDVNEAAKIIGCGAKAVRTAVRSGTMPALPLKWKILIPRGALMRWIESGGKNW